MSTSPSPNPPSELSDGLFVLIYSNHPYPYHLCPPSTSPLGTLKSFQIIFSSTQSHPLCSLMYCPFPIHNHPGNVSVLSNCPTLCCLRSSQFKCTLPLRHGALFPSESVLPPIWGQPSILVSCDHLHQSAGMWHLLFSEDMTRRIVMKRAFEPTDVA